MSEASINKSGNLPKASKPILSTKMLLLCGLFAALSAVGAFIRVPIPVIPFTLQLPIVMLAGIILGAKGALFSQLVYLLVGLVGFPVFTKGGGIGYFLEPTFGYLIGFAAGAWAVGFFLEKAKNYKLWNIFLACIIGVIISYIFGVVYMYFILNFYLKSTITIGAAAWTGAAIFFPKDALLCFLASVIGVRLRPALKM